MSKRNTSGPFSTAVDPQERNLIRARLIPPLLLIELNSIINSLDAFRASGDNRTSALKMGNFAKAGLKWLSSALALSQVQAFYIPGKLGACWDGAA